ncbi:MAG TPA: hypothetical protein VG755_01670 [Nannocystaceae bacterium]|nr:hypothetical protein [Nannocystaceae bacterium]
MRPLVYAALAMMACAHPDDEAADDDDAWDVPRRCIAPAGLGRPATIDDVVTLMNALPMPVTLPCFLEALDRPLGLTAATSPFSAQPTDSFEDPRLFLHDDALVMTIVTTGEASAVLELGEYTGPGRSRKAELELPVREALPRSAPYARTILGEGTSCALCHADERFTEDVEGLSTYTSEALAPEPEREISVAFVEQHARACVDADPSDRCALLQAVFAHGDVHERAFPPEARICITP